jgi:hypothetical protein
MIQLPPVKAWPSLIERAKQYADYSGMKFPQIVREALADYLSGRGF